VQLAFCEGRAFDFLPEGRRSVGGRLIDHLSQHSKKRKGREGCNVTASMTARTARRLRTGREKGKVAKEAFTSQKRQGKRKKEPSGESLRSRKERGKRFLLPCDYPLKKEGGGKAKAMDILNVTKVEFSQC